jgi:hypothetical protein
MILSPTHYSDSLEVILTCNGGFKEEEKCLLHVAVTRTAERKSAAEGPRRGRGRTGCRASPWQDTFPGLTPRAAPKPMGYHDMLSVKHRRGLLFAGAGGGGRSLIVSSGIVPTETLAIKGRGTPVSQLTTATRGPFFVL